ncbi:hypothetical protein K443DRAFT_118090 [Laccaria amethystina LaAM-08-1]|uniref:Uncharacterized protein n=1 Tax=Laccaria amethystina LaAM-08-1 TaxID=1095629 RepID=A0A0C9Y7N2_9AGAR|nr:hypothetical protein K443DRAFT_118090 [Laccaria amethystina LaAM-08-1]
MDIDEVIADSEDEFDNHDTSAIIGTSGLPSHIPTFSNKPDKRVSSISTISTVGPDTISAILPQSNTASTSEISIPKSRPKPRPIKKKKDGGTTSSNTENFVPAFHINPMTGKPDYLAAFQPDHLPMTSSIADRAKTRQRAKPASLNTTSKFRGDDVIELSDSDDDDFDELVLRPSTSKNKSKKSKSKPSEPTTSATTTKPKPRPIAKRTAPAPIPDSTPQPTNPSPARPIPIPFRLLPSQLPPSDPSVPTSQPPIEVLQNPPTTDFDDPLTPTSSPCSLFSPKKGVDELDESDHGESFVHVDKGNGKTLMLPPAMAQPPPTFFAGSSPPLPVPETIPSREKPLEQDVVDLTDLPPTVPVEKPKPKKPRKKKEEVGSGDGMDMDFDPNNSEGKKKKKGKTKAKGKEKTSPGTGQVEVTITVPPPKTKGKGRGKGKEKEKEVFKSKEFVNDSEDEDEGVLGGAIPTTSSINILPPPAIGSPPPAIGSPPAAPALVPGSPGLGKKRKSNTVDEEEVEEVGSPKKKQKGKGRGKKEKSGAALGEEGVARGHEGGARGKKGPAQRGEDVALGEEDASLVDEEIHVGRKKKPKSAKGKGKMVVLSDQEEDEVRADDKQIEDEEEDCPVANRRGKENARKKGKGKGTLDEDEDQDMAPPKQGHDDDRGGTKYVSQENVEPVSKIIPQPIATPKPSLFPSLASRYTIAPRVKSTPMSELIRRVNSVPGSPFPSPHPRVSSSSSSAAGPTCYSPYLKSSRSMLSRIAPLHPNRRTPPPPLPPPPPRKKTKKELEREEKWEEEMVESVGGINEWACLTDAERREMRRVKWEREMGGWDE